MKSGKFELQINFYRLREKICGKKRWSSWGYHASVCENPSTSARTPKIAGKLFASDQNVSGYFVKYGTVPIVHSSVGESSVISPHGEGYTQIDSVSVDDMRRFHSALEKELKRGKK